MGAVLPGFDAVPGLERVAEAYRKSERADEGGPGFTVCVSNGEGALVAAEHLGSYNQVKAFSRAMAKIGYQASIAGGPRQGCDVVYTPRPQARDIFDDGGPQSTMSGI
ncbi:MAG: hypothetical protein JWQ76_1877 [Ramlibacter sp.]|nr:hypothetical protein [Ramlibacter sp.]